jgi:alpha-ketoglutarate-dependent sulfate ester dioxygenase
VFRLLQDRVIKLENTIRWSWEPGDLAIWDNRATQHYAVGDYAPYRRVAESVAVEGDRPA